CKTWEGELALVSLPGTTVEKFIFTVRDDAVAEQINKVMGQRVSLHYEEKVGLPTTCFGETRHFVTGVTAMAEVPLVPGVVVPTARTSPATRAAPAAPTPVAAPPSMSASGSAAAAPSPRSGGGPEGVLLASGGRQAAAARRRGHAQHPLYAHRCRCRHDRDLV